MWKQTQSVLEEPGEWLGDGHRLLRQLGSAHSLVALSRVSAEFRIDPVLDLSSLRSFLQDYQRRILTPIELPAIQRAFDHGCRHEVRELMELDRELAAETVLKPFAEASWRVGRRELGKMRALRDERLVRRYLEAVEHGDAHAWHTVVYGLILALYSLPLRQGLLAYGFQTAHGFIRSAAGTLRLSQSDCRGLLDELCHHLPPAVEVLIARRAAA
jgi:urease accessory protein UreF